MQRRTVLAALSTSAVALAGCVTGGTSGGDGEHSGNGNDDDGNNENGTDNNGNDDNSGQPNGDIPEDSLVAHFDEAPTRPECEYESETVEVKFGGETDSFETAEVVPYPEPPASFTEDEITNFVKDYEEAYVRYNAVCPAESSGHILSVAHTVELTETFDWYDDIHIVSMYGVRGATSGLDSDGNLWEADMGYSGVVYAVDETAVARADFDEAGKLEPDEFEEEAPDPVLEGALLSAFA